MRSMFIEQEATKHLLECVSSYCSLCYTTLSEGENIYYDTDNYRYLCYECAKELAEQKEIESKMAQEEEESLPTLF